MHHLDWIEYTNDLAFDYYYNLSDAELIAAENYLEGRVLCPELIRQFRAANIQQNPFVCVADCGTCKRRLAHCILVSTIGVPARGWLV